ncbi:hypothetical protein ACPWSR_12240 [Alloiococcus sp. CFN-8]|uniref:hypothetical protein n=1 Tax=Alloiococcus sp. CFN-8 TaxID=3416081 RepID=UPI003CEF197D
MNTPIVDFVRAYSHSDTRRFHMPGHKGKVFLGCEALDITEIYGGDSLYQAEGIIAESERNATELFNSGRTIYSTEGSSQCIRAMLYLTLLRRKKDIRPAIVAARNVHKAFIYAAALLDFEVIWLWPEGSSDSICSCHISPEKLEMVLKKNQASVAGVYVTSPDYLGGRAEISALAEVCHRNGTILAVDNAHGAYLNFLEPSQHPLALGADICCDSAHKTLPVLTGGAYLHISKNAPVLFREQAKHAMELFGSTSPSYVIMASLDLCNKYLSESYCLRLKETINNIEACRSALRKSHWKVKESDPLRIAIEIPMGISSDILTDRLREHQVECEYADPDYIVFMITPENTEEDLNKLLLGMGENNHPYVEKKELPVVETKQAMSIRAAMFAEPESILAREATGRICRVPTVSCPPAIPIAVPGELIDEHIINLFQYYGIKYLDVVKANDKL